MLYPSATLRPETLLGRTINWNGAGPVARISVGIGVLAAVAFFVLGFEVGGDWFLLDLALGVAAFSLGHLARSRRPRRREKRWAVAGMMLGGAVVVAFAAYLIVTAVT